MNKAKALDKILLTTTILTTQAGRYMAYITDKANEQRSSAVNK